MYDVVVAVVGLFARAHGLVYGKLVHSSTRNVNHEAINRMQFLCATCFCPLMVVSNYQAVVPQPRAVKSLSLVADDTTRVCVSSIHLI